MDDALFMHVVDGFQHLPNQVGRILFRVRAFLDNAVEQLSTGYSAIQSEWLIDGRPSTDQTQQLEMFELHESGIRTCGPCRLRTQSSACMQVGNVNKAESASTLASSVPSSRNHQMKYTNGRSYYWQLTKLGTELLESFYSDV